MEISPLSKLEYTHHRQNDIEKLLHKQYEWIECDVFLLKDGNIGVLHNKDQMLTQEAVEQSTVPELATKISNMIPRIEDYLSLNSFRNKRILFEIKASTTDNAVELTDKLVPQICHFYDRYREKLPTPAEYPQNWTRINSFSIEALQEAKIKLEEENQNIPLGLIWNSTPHRATEMAISLTALQYVAQKKNCTVEEVLNKPEQENEKQDWINSWTREGISCVKENGFQKIALHYSVITPEIIEYASNHGITVSAWTIKDAVKAEELLAIGVSEIIYE